MTLLWTRHVSTYLGTIHLRRLHFLAGGGVSPLPTFADSRGVGVSGMPTPSISIFLPNGYIECLVLCQLKKNVLHTLISLLRIPILRPNRQYNASTAEMA